MDEGWLLIDKPEGISSFGVVAHVRGILLRELKAQHVARGYCRQTTKGLTGGTNCRCRIKVGHTGTLDPAATGLLIVAIGAYTKKVPKIIKRDKTYDVTMKLGETSTTGDKEGDIAVKSDIVPDLREIKATLEHFTGEQMQTPPSFSAVKVNGKRAYDLARMGKEVLISPRPVTIYHNKLITYEYPYVRFISEVSSGTYIRSLVEDIGRLLGTGAYMSDLRRTKIGSISINDGVVLADLNTETIHAYIVKSLH